MEKNKKINILYMPSLTEGGVFYYRCLTPMLALKKSFSDNYEITITNDLDTAWKLIRLINVLIIHNCLYNNDIQLKVWNLVAEAKKIGIKTVLDMDDYWDYGQEHPLYKICLSNSFPIKSTVNFNIFDYVTTTTERLRDEIKVYNKNVYIIENAISNDDEQYSFNKNKSNRIRFGLTGGSSHTSDIKQLINENETFFDYIDDDVKNKVQLVLCGFNTDGSRIKIDENGKHTTEKLNPDEVWWVQLEKQVTKNYSIVSPEYKEVLLKYDHSDEQFDTSNEPYKRIWAKSIANLEYGKIYEDIDVLLVPLTDTFFNQKKSELKFTESGFTNTAIITSKVVPYTDYGVENEDCLFVQDMTPKGWADKVSEIANNNELRIKLASKLNKRILEERNLEQMTKKRHNLYQNIMNGFLQLITPSNIIRAAEKLAYSHYTGMYLDKDMRPEYKNEIESITNYMVENDLKQLNFNGFGFELKSNRKLYML